MSKIGFGVVMKVHKKLLSCQKRSPVTLSTCCLQGRLKGDGLCMWRSVIQGLCWGLLVLLLVMKEQMRNELRDGAVIGEGGCIFIFL